MKPKTKKNLLLFTLLVGPLLFYILISTGINNFKRLPILTESVHNISTLDSSQTFVEKISIVCFLGDDVLAVKGGFFNLNEKIYKPFYGFTDFQIIGIYPKGKEKEVAVLKNELGAFTDMVKWNFIAADSSEIELFYASFATITPLQKGYSSEVFIVDKDLNLRGRTANKETGESVLFGYNMQSVAALNNIMKDDVKIVLAEYRLALKRKKNKRKI